MIHSLSGDDQEHDGAGGVDGCIPTRILYIPSFLCSHPEMRRGCHSRGAPTSTGVLIVITQPEDRNRTTSPRPGRRVARTLTDRWFTRKLITRSIKGGEYDDPDSQGERA